MLGTGRIDLAERVEAFSSPLHVGLLAAARAFGISLFSWTKALGVLFTLAELAALAALLWKTTRSALLPLLGGILFATDRIVGVWATGGLETSMYSALLFGWRALGHAPHAVGERRHAI